MNKPIVEYIDLKGLSYQEAWDLQTKYHDQLKINKKEWANLPEEEKPNQLHKLIFCEHSHVYTLGKSGKKDHLLLSEAQLNEEKIEFFPINRGGDITYHGPGQITGYPILDMDEFYHDIRKYVHDLEQSVIDMIAEYGIIGDRIEGYTGVWITDKKPYKKICAIGVHVSRWVTLHGFALNVNTDLNYFKKIVPCGIDDPDKDVTSIAEEIGRSVDIEEVKTRLKRTFAKNLNFEYGREV